MTNFLERLDKIISERHLLNHPFYQAWNEGKLSQEALLEYSKEYYRQVHAFPTYVSATHAACDDIKIRQMLLENLIEEEQGEDNHPELWLRFAERMGATKEEVRSHKALPKTLQSVRILKQLAQSENAEVGMAALYAYESQIPEVSTTKIDGLKKFYDVSDERSLSFFTEHETADVLHSEATRSALTDLCSTPEKEERALQAAEEAADALNLLLDGVVEAHCTDMAA
ncbi:MAG: TenA family transcriptional regulator [Myxococcales bacterium]|nr:TenA family transcriptional regulator [Myxococcales bacterium]|tara:strand:- start:4989 stop:5669 length:681 start_codon:yes stop_codon:yes gene_type:complete